MSAPNRHKLALLTWSLVYPMITLLMLVLEPVIADLPMPLRTFALTVVMVPALVYWAMPLATSHLRHWLSLPR